MADKIFISYRRDDAAGDARGIYEGLVRCFGKANVFMDVDSLVAGQRFDRELDKALAACAVLIAVIGPRWMEVLLAKAASGERDYVREEVAAALKRGIIVIPVRVGQEGRLTPLPRAGDLPEDIRDLVQHQKHDVVHESFGRNLADLIAAIRVLRRGERPPLPKAIGIAAAAVAPPPAPTKKRPKERAPLLVPDSPEFEATRALLARHVGPIAKVLVQKAAAEAQSFDDLCERLAVHVRTPGDRAAFLQAARARLKA
jgi:hypothetical protein